MITAIRNFFIDCLSLTWLTGAIFDRELRVASRRYRSYVLRVAYVTLMILILVFYWFETVQTNSTVVYQASRMSSAGKSIVTFIVWFQFCAGQLVACVMLSNAISDEIYHKTLGILMTTPINSFQIVIGKLLSRLLQLILLLAISLPLLAIVRIFGGVPWGYITSSLCITFSTIILVGSLSLFYSIFCQKAYVVIIRVILTIGIIFALFPILSILFWDVMEWKHVVSERNLMGVLFLPNPYINMFFNTENFFSPRSMTGMPFFFWQVNCVIMLAVSGVILLLSISLVRKVALRQATGQSIFAIKKRSAKKTSEESNLAKAVIREVKGPAVLWKEMRFPMFGKYRTLKILSVIAILSLLCFTYWLLARAKALDTEEVQIAYVLVFFTLGVIYTAVIPATTITSEKESQAWFLLLTTTIENREILEGKFLGSLRRILPAWILLFVHLSIFILVGYIKPDAFLQIAVVSVGVIVFLSCSGIFFSSLFKHTTTAVVMNFVLAAAIWGLFPLSIVLISEILQIRDKSTGFCMDIHPFFQVGNIIATTAHRSSILYEGVALPRMNVFEYDVLIFMCMICYCLAGCLFSFEAGRRLRKNIF
jgi:ABC-2 type transport system permease protein